MKMKESSLTNVTDSESDSHIPSNKKLPLIKLLLDPTQKSIENQIIGKDIDLNQMKDQLNGEGYQVLNVFPRTHLNGQEFFV